MLRRSTLYRSLIISLIVFGGYLLVTRLSVVGPTSTSGLESSLQLKQLFEEVGGRQRDAKTLVLLANNYELRAGGGFIGTVGLLKGSNGKVQLDSVRSVYFYDHRIEEKQTFVPVPGYLSELTAHLAVRDTLNSDDESANARLARDLFARETGIYAEQVLVLTPSVLESVLGVTGPIDLPEYGLTVRQDNLLDTLQKEVEAGKDKQAGKDPKTVLSVLFDKLMSRLPELSVQQVQAMTSVFELSATNRQLTFLAGQQLDRNMLARFRPSMRSNATRFTLLTANRGANKSSRSIRRQLNLDLTLNESGYMQAAIQIDLRHETDYFGAYTDPRSGESKWLIGDDNSWYSLNLPPRTRVLSAPGWLAESDDKLVKLTRTMAIKPLQKAQVDAEVELPTQYVLGRRLVVDLEIIKQFGLVDQDIRLTLRVPDGYRLVQTNETPTSGTDIVTYAGRQATDLGLSYVFEK